MSKGSHMRWPRIGERIFLAGDHPRAGEEAVVLNYEKPFAHPLFGLFPAIRIDSGMLDYIFKRTDWRIIHNDS
jgi:hypothetical protein